MAECEEFDSFLSTEVAARLKDQEGGVELKTHLRSLAITGFATQSLEAIFEADLPEERDWAIAEAFSEVFLSREYAISWPWNMERDKRTPKASLPGADLVGFQTVDGKVLLVLGEVKSSSATAAPPDVMYGRGGMTHQLDRLASDLSLISQLIKWLWPRCKKTEHEASFNSAIGHFFESGNKAVALFGVLVRDTSPNVKDLETRGKALGKTIQATTTCCLCAVYLPCGLQELPQRVSGEAAA